ncbi:hypothetical protein AKO1_011125 [Acrasis kona]|uniref:BTB domain-containing protein n=1 Tax=Acrasis kona TaxID=1008807 RepID=A0AAW2Z0X0_9EUKA
MCTRPLEVIISDLSPGAVKLMIDYCVTDRLLIDELTSYTSMINQSSPCDQVLVEVFCWSIHNSKKSSSPSCSSSSLDGLKRFAFLVFRQLFISIHHHTAISIYNALIDQMNVQDTNLANQPQYEQLRSHLIGYFYKSCLDKTFGQLKDYQALDKSTLTEILVQGHESKFLDLSNALAPSSTLREDMMRLFHQTQSRKDGDVVLVLDRKRVHLLHAHKVILACRCDYFKKEFSSGMREQNQSEVELFGMGLLMDDDHHNLMIAPYSDDVNEEDDANCLQDDGCDVDSEGHIDQDGDVVQQEVEGDCQQLEEDDREREERVKVIRQFIEYLYSGNIVIDESNAVAMLNLLNYFSLPIHHPLCVQCQSVIIDQVDSQSVLQIMRAFIINKNNPYPVLEEACIRTCVKQWRVLHDTYSDKQLVDMLSLDLYLKINRQALIGRQ